MMMVGLNALIIILEEIRNVKKPLTELLHGTD
jgi:hypothetical protein